jgi:hypothetical protein
LDDQAIDIGEQAIKEVEMEYSDKLLSEVVLYSTQWVQLDQDKIFDGFDSSAYPIDDSIIQCRIHRDTCLFLSIYNGIRCPYKRYAFSCGNPVDPCSAFVKYIGNRTRESDRIAKEGYTFNDVFLYLRKIKSEGWISGFFWEKYKYRSTCSPRPKKKSKSFGLTTLFGTQDYNPGVYVLFGESVATDNRLSNKKSKIMKKKKKKMTFDQQAGHPLVTSSVKEILEGCRFYDETSARCPISLVDYGGDLVPSYHGIALCGDCDGRIYMYDDRCQKRKRVDPLLLRDSVVHIFESARFDISIKYPEV